MTHSMVHAAAVALLGGLAACGYSTGDRAVSGGLTSPNQVELGRPAWR